MVTIRRSTTSSFDNTDLNEVWLPPNPADEIRWEMFEVHLHTTAHTQVY